MRRIPGSLNARLGAGIGATSVLALTQQPPPACSYCATDMSSWRGPRSAAKGAETPAWLASAPFSAEELASMQGKFFYDKREIAW